MREGEVKRRRRSCMKRNLKAYGHIVSVRWKSERGNQQPWLIRPRCPGSCRLAARPNPEVPFGGPGLADVRWESVTVELVVTLRALVDLHLVRCAENSAESRAS